eukprot:15430861-Alexandrium_andersonii.AAC.1
MEHPGMRGPPFPRVRLRCADPPYELGCWRQVVRAQASKGARPRFDLRNIGLRSTTPGAPKG